MVPQRGHSGLVFQAELPFFIGVGDIVDTIPMAYDPIRVFIAKYIPGAVLVVIEFPCQELVLVS